MFKSHKKLKLTIISITVALVVLIGACGIYLGDYYRADTQAIEAFASVSVETGVSEDGTMTFGDENAEIGFIFYPGGKVEYTAYIPLMQACASKGIFCVLLEMPFNLAVFDVNGADGITEQYPQIENWYIGGHSLGGSMASSYAQNNAENFDGVILLGSYSTADLASAGLDVLSIYGSEDTVLNRDKYDEYKSNLPPDFTECVIDGGCHAYFGVYGAQEGDGIPHISNEEQINTTADAIALFTGKK